MAFLANGIRTYLRRSERERIAINPDDPLNFRDQEANIKARIRQLDLQRYLDLLTSSSPLILLGGGLLLLATRKYRAGAVVLGAFIAQQAWVGIRAGDDTTKENSKWKNRELERYALKLERGDYGHYEVIPFR